MCLYCLTPDRVKYYLMADAQIPQLVPSVVGMSHQMYTVLTWRDAQQIAPVEFERSL